MTYLVLDIKIKTEALLLSEKGISYEANYEAYGNKSSLALY